MQISSRRRKDLVAVVALAGALGVLAVRRLPRLLYERATYSDGASVYEDLAEVRHAVWSPAERLGAQINTPARESRPALSPDGRWLVFVEGELGLSCDLWIAPIENGEPGEPRPLAGLNTTADELAPAFGVEGLYFASDRSGGLGGYDLWLAPFDDGMPGPAVALDAGINTASDELDPAPVLLTTGGRALAFASNRSERGDFDLYLSYLDGPPDEVVPAERLDALSSEANDREPAFAAGGRTLYLASDRGEGGDYSIYRTLRENGTWLPPRKVQGLGQASARAPAPSADGFTLYFEASPSLYHEPSDRDLFRARSIELLQRPPPDLGWADLVLVGLLLSTALLAWLAKSWNSLDVLYKCFVASILVHLILMWISAYVRSNGPTSELEPGFPDPGDGTISLTLRPAGGETARWGERGGNLQGAGRGDSLTEAGGPERLGLALAHNGPSSAPAAQIGRAQGTLGEAPGPEGSGPERDTTTGLGGALEIRAPAESFARFEGSAPQVELVASSAGSAGVEHGAEGGAAPSGPDVGALAAAGRARSAAPGGAGVAAPRAAAGDGPGFAEAPGVVRGPIGAGESGSVALAGPTESFQPLQSSDSGSGSRELELSPATAFKPGSGSGTGTGEGSGAGSGALAGPTAWGGGSDAGSGSAARRAAPGPAQGLERRGSDVAAAADGLGSGGGAGVERSQAPSALAGGPELSQPAERFEPRGGAGSGSGSGNGGGGASDAEGRGAGGAVALGLPTAASFAPEHVEGGGGGSGPARWKGTGTGGGSGGGGGFGPGGAVAPPALALTAEPREDAKGLPEAPRKLEDTPYRSRFGPEREIALSEHGGGADTELGVARGLAYLASIQNSDGSWGDPDHRDDKYRQVAIGKTGLALLAFLGAGHTAQGGEHSEVARAAIDFLLAHQKLDTGHFGEGCSYSHGIATYALAECYALTRDEKLRRPLERAVAQILRNQYEGGDERVAGGWSYYYHDGAVFDRWPRASITSWQVMALESARLGGIAVPDASFEAARSFLLHSWDPRLGAFRYSHDPERLRSGYPTLPGSTPAAMFALGLLGEDISSAPFDDARRYLLERAPSGFRFRGDEAFVTRATGNVYFWYYGSLALFRLGGNEWERWNTALKETLLPAQEADGSWPPLDVYAKSYAGDDDRERSYTTAMCVLSLEVYYRYFTPLLQVR
jgi:WD40-like Beta Propeller Repeat